MSKVKIEGNASGSGTLTISAPNTDTDRALTLPDTAGEIFVGDITSGDLPAGSVVQVQTASLGTEVSIANSGTGRVYTDLLTISYTPVSSSNELVLLGTSGFGSNLSSSDRGAFGIVFEVNGDTYQFSNYPWYEGSSRKYPGYPPETTVSGSIAVPTGSTFNIKLKGFSYNESVGTMTPRFRNYALTVMEIAQ